MRDPFELIRIKEQQIAQVKREIEALRIAGRLLEEEAHPANGDKSDFRQPVEMP
jgi:hypothetical protein